MITLTESARRELATIIEAESGSRTIGGLRVAVEGGSGFAGFQYGLTLIDAGETNDDDRIFDVEGIRVVVDPRSAELLDGATIDFETSLQQSGFRVDNPNERNVEEDPQAKAVQELIDEKINPAVASHGGHVSLVDLRDDVVYLRLGGGCQGCGMVDVTLRQGIEVMIKEALPQVKEVVDVTDHRQGTNPYYQPQKG